jgi:tetratricopeptide (TPR) repeat protein
MQSPRVQRLALLLLAGATLLVYSQVGEHQFIIFDDPRYVVDNPHVHAGLTTESIRWAFTTTSGSNWHPLTWLSYMVNYELHGLKPAGYLLTNLLLHVANSLLLFFALRQLTGAVWRSLFVAALFALHPLHVESVAWVSERKDVLSAFFWMLALWAYGRYATGPRSIGRYLPVVLCLALGLMAKAMLVTLPFVLLLLDFWPLGRFKTERNTDRIDWSRWKPLILEKLPLLGVVAGASSLALFTQSQGGAVLGGLPLHLRVGNALVAYVAYIGKTIWPSRLGVFYPHPGDTLSLALVLGAALFLSAVSVLVVLWARRRPYLLIGWLWYLGTLVPVIGLVQIGSQAMADRYTYLPLTGLFVMAAWGLAELFEKRPLRQSWAMPAALAALGALTLCTWLQVGYWKNSVTLFEHTLRVTKENRLVHFNLGAVLMSERNDRPAIHHFEEALKIDPRFFPAHQNLETIFARHGDVEAARRHGAAALWLVAEKNGLYGVEVRAGTLVELLTCSRTETGSGSADRDGGPSVASRERYRRGTELARQGRIDEALPHLQAAVQLEPACVELRLALGTALLIAQRRADAIQQYGEALRLRPDDPRAHYRLAIALAEEGRIEEASEHLSEFLRQRPQHAAARRMMRAIRRNAPLL